MVRESTIKLRESMNCPGRAMIEDFLDARDLCGVEVVDVQSDHGRLRGFVNDETTLVLSTDIEQIQIGHAMRQALELGVLAVMGEATDFDYEWIRQSRGGETPLCLVRIAWAP